MININNMGSLIAGFVISLPEINELNLRFAIATKLSTLFPSADLYEIDKATSVALDHLVIWMAFLGQVEKEKVTIQ
jgi:hypothetical protein